MMRVLGIESACWRDGRLELCVFSWGISVGGGSAGYLRAPDRPSPIVKSIEDFVPANPHRYKVFRELGGDWYLYREWSS